MRGAGLALAIAAALAGPARGDPSNGALIATGLALAPPTYLVGVTLHEGSHAVAALVVGATVDQLHLFPPGRDPTTGTFRFGWTYVRGLRTTGDKIAFYLAPKVSDAALVFTGAWPGNRYGQLALTVFATGLWVDFAKDVVLFAPTNDVVHAFDLWGMTGWSQVPARLVYAGLAVGFGLVVAHGYERTFDRPAMTTAARPLLLPLVSAAF